MKQKVKNSFSKSSRKWLVEHNTDSYVQQAKKAGYRSRAAYKLEQLDERDKLFKPNMTIVDLGAAPGGWSQWVQRRLENKVRLFALDILPIDPLPDVTFIQGDFHDEAVLQQLLGQIGESKADLVMSDMAPNMSGMKAVDQPRSMLLAELARDLALDILAPQGHFLTKVFQGEGFDVFIKDLRQHFTKVLIRKPDASRARSPEVYVLAKHFRGHS